MNDITKIESPLKSGACSDCANHYKNPDGGDVCSANHIGIRTRMCAKIPVCNLFYRNYSAGGLGIKG